MAIFNLFGTKSAKSDDVKVTEEGNVLQVTNEKEGSSEQEASDDEKKKMITITWGTGMPIDVIFNYIHKDFEEEGYQDALVNSDTKYRQVKEEIIKNDLQMLLKRITLRYKNDVRVIDVKIDNARKAYALSSAAMLEARRVSYEEHLEEIAEMGKLLEDEDPKMMTMIESYRRGFQKGIAAITLKFINHE